MIRKHVIFHGRVQGVGFRVFAWQNAAELKITGSAKNLYDGTVELEAQGQEEKVDEFLARLEKGTFAIRVTGMDITNMELKEEKEFRITY